MPLYIIGVIERYERSFTIEADSEEEAIAKAGEISNDDEGELFEYHSTAPSDTWNVTPITEPTE